MPDFAMCSNWQLCPASSLCKRSPEVSLPSEHFQPWIAVETEDDGPCELYLPRC